MILVFAQIKVAGLLFIQTKKRQNYGLNGTIAILVPRFMWH